MTSHREFCPYVGLQPFTEEDREYFFGRERDGRIISSNLYASSLTILYGTSGVGKSSVLLAGVVPRLRSSAQTAVVVFRDWRDSSIIGNIKAECIKLAKIITNKQIDIDPNLSLDEFLLSISQFLSGSIFIIFDQFEEYFLYHPEFQTETVFEAQFALAINREEVDTRFMIVIREDGLSKLDERFRVRVPNLLSNTLRLRHLDLTSAEDAIRKPLMVYNEQFSRQNKKMNIEGELIIEILSQVQTGKVLLSKTSGIGQGQSDKHTAQIETPFLQLVMTRLWEEEHKVNSSVLRLSTLERLGGAQEIVRMHLDGTMNRLNVTKQEVCSRFFDRLVTPSGTKIACNIDDLTNWAGDLSEQVNPVLKTLSDDRILRSASAPNDQRGKLSYEIYHDVLAPAILDWRTRYIQEREKEETQKKAALEATKAARERMRRLITYGLSIGFLLAVVMIVLVVLLWRSTEGQRKIALSRQLAAQASEYYDNQLDRGMLLNLHAKQLQYTTESLGSLLVGLEKIQFPPTFLKGHSERVYSLAISPKPNDNILASASKDQSIRLWNIKTGQLIAQSEDLGGWVNTVAFNPDGNIIASGSGDGNIKLWESDTLSEIGSYKIDNDWVKSVAFTPDGKKLVSNSGKGEIIIWGIAPEGQNKKTKESGTSFAIDSRGKILAIGNQDGGINLIDLEDPELREMHNERHLHEDSIESLAFSPRDNILASGGKDKNIILWDFISKSRVREPLTGHEEQIKSLAFSPNGEFLASGGADSSIIIWDIRTGERIGEVKNLKDWVLSVVFSSDGNYLASASGEGRIIIWDVQDLKSKGEICASNRGFVTSLSISPQGMLMAKGNDKGEITLCDIKERRLLNGYFETSEGWISSLAFNPEGNILASGSENGPITIWDIGKNAPLRKLYGHTNWVVSLSFSSDGKTLASGSWDKTVMLWDVPTGKRLLQLPDLKKHENAGHKDWVTSVAFSPKGNLVASGSRDKTIILWDANVGEPVSKPLEHHNDWVISLAFSPDGKTLASGSRDNSIVLWDVLSRQIIGIPLEGHRNWVTSMAFSPDGNFLASGSRDHSTIMWDVKTRRRIARIHTNHVGSVLSVYISKDGKMLSSAGDGDTIIESPIDIVSLEKQACKIANRELTNEESKELLKDVPDPLNKLWIKTKELFSDYNYYSKEVCSDVLK